MPTFPCCPGVKYRRKMMGMHTTAGPAGHQHGCYRAVFGMEWNGQKWIGGATGEGGASATGEAALSCEGFQLRITTHGTISFGGGCSGGGGTSHFIPCGADAVASVAQFGMQSTCCPTGSGVVAGVFTVVDRHEMFAAAA